jgi:osmoprotectant transport system permease protein
VADLWEFLTTADNWQGGNGITHRLVEHLQVCGVALVLAMAISLPPALVLGHVKRGGLLAASIVNIGRAVPTFAILSLLFPISLRLGFVDNLGFWPTVVAMVLLAIPPVFTNAYTGVRDVDPAMVEASKGMGMQPRQVLWRAEVPSALPLVIAGVRVTAVQVVATATLGAFVGFGGLGAFIVAGRAQRDTGKLLTGVVLVALLAIVVELAFGALERKLTPWTRRRRGARDSRVEPPVGSDPLAVATPT